MWYCEADAVKSGLMGAVALVMKVEVIGLDSSSVKEA